MAGVLFENVHPPATGTARLQLRAGGYARALSAAEAWGGAQLSSLRASGESVLLTEGSADVGPLRAVGAVGALSVGSAHIGPLLAVGDANSAPEVGATIGTAMLSGVSTTGRIYTTVRLEGSAVIQGLQASGAVGASTIGSARLELKTAGFIRPKLDSSMVVYLSSGYAWITGVEPDAELSADDTGIFTETGFVPASLQGRDRGLLQDSGAAVIGHIADASDTGLISESLGVRRRQPMTDTAVLSEAAAAKRRLVATDLGLLTDAGSAVRKAVVSGVDVCVASEAFSVPRILTSEDTGTLSDSAATRRTATAVDIAVLSEAFAALRTHTLAATDVAIGSELGGLKVHYVISGVDVGWLTEHVMPIHVAGDVTAWSANTDTWAASRYTNVRFNSAFEMGGTVYGVDDSGVHAMDADTDNGTSIPASLSTGLFSGREGAQRRFTYMYADAVVDGGMEVVMHDVNEGSPGAFSYRFEPRDSHDVAPQRAKLGRGVKSSYFKVVIRNVDGSYFDVVGLTALTDTSKRRV